ncbi:hypothetical protein B0H11DRAFT_2278278, partial [Mycena galericulata]
MAGRAPRAVNAFAGVHRDPALSTTTPLPDVASPPPPPVVIPPFPATATLPPHPAGAATAPSTLDRALSVFAAGRRSLSRSPSPTPLSAGSGKGKGKVPPRWTRSSARRTSSLSPSRTTSPTVVEVDDASVCEHVKPEPATASGNGATANADALDNELSPLVVLLMRLCAGDADAHAHARVAAPRPARPQRRRERAREPPDTLGAHGERVSSATKGLRGKCCTPCATEIRVRYYEVVYFFLLASLQHHLVKALEQLFQSNLRDVCLLLFVVFWVRGVDHRSGDASSATSTSIAARGAGAGSRLCTRPPKCRTTPVPSLTMCSRSRLQATWVTETACYSVFPLRDDVAVLHGGLQ